MMKNYLFLFFFLLMIFNVCLYADAPWQPNVRVSIPTSWDTLNQGESCFAIFGDSVFSICNTAERGSVPIAPYAYSFDNGQSFNQIPFTDYNAGIGWHTDPVIGVDDSGYVHMLIQFSATFMRHYLSRDGGLSWVDTTQINSYNGVDKPWWVVHNNEIFVTWQQISGQQGIWFARSTDYGHTFTDYRIWTTNGITALCMDESGNLHLAVVTWGDQVYYLKSTDQGQNWTTPKYLASYSYSSSYGDRAPINSITANGDVVFITWVDNSYNGSWDVNAIRSTDGGNTWGAPFIINDITSGGQCKGWAHFDCYGGLHFFYYNTPDWPTDSSSLFSIRYQFSPDSGATFNPGIRLSDVNFISHNDFMGEYHILRSDSAYLYAQWTDGRNSNYNDLYFSKALLTELATEEELPKNTSDYSIFQVPTIWRGKVTMKIAGYFQDLDIKAYDISGRSVCTIYTGKVSKTTNRTINSDKLPKGILFLKATTFTASETIKVINFGL